MPSIFSDPRCNRRVSCDASPSNARSESALTVNPLDPYNLVGSSKRFTDPATYEFSLVAHYTFDGRLTWGESSLALPAGKDGISDPAVAFDDLGNVTGGVFLRVQGPETQNGMTQGNALAGATSRAPASDRSRRATRPSGVEARKTHRARLNLQRSEEHNE